MQHLLEAHNIYSLSQQVLGFFLKEAHTQRGFVLLADSPYHHIAATEGFEPANLTNTEHPDAKCYLAAVETVRTQEPLFSAAALSLPLTVHNQCLGVIYLDEPSELVNKQLFCDLTKLTADVLFNLHRIKTKETDLKSTKKLLNQQQFEVEIHKHSFDSFIGISRKKHELFQLIHKTLNSNATITLTGESGAGKELVAQIIHYNSLRAHRRFVAFNCAAIPEALLESELFGYMKGSFTGAEDDHVGLFVKAHGGTLFLDEIGEMPPCIQSKLLRVLQDKEVCPVGSDKPIMVDVRIICTTNHDLDELVAKGLFREDLFYRINVVMINIPPLRERREDIPLIAEHALAQYAAENNTLQKDFTDEVKKYLMNYPWPGNARELTNVMYNLAIFVEGPTITLNDILSRKGLLTHPIIHEATLDDADETLLNLSRMIDEGQMTLSAAKRAFEKLQIARALKLYNGQITSASEHLKMPRPQVSRLIKRYGLKV